MPVAPEVEYVVPIPDGVSASLDGFKLTIKGPKGTLQREFKHEKVKMSLDEKGVRIYCALPKKKDAALAGTWRAHVKNMIRGVTEGFRYELKIVYAHFPMKVSVRGRKVVIENFLGEKTPRYADIYGDVKVTVKGNTVIVEGINVEECGQTAANIERATRIKGRDPRVFQDGIYIVSKKG